MQAHAAAAVWQLEDENLSTRWIPWRLVCEPWASSAASGAQVVLGAVVPCESWLGDRYYDKASTICVCRNPGQYRIVLLGSLVWNRRQIVTRETRVSIL